jgi:hypothetical protein
MKRILPLVFSLWCGYTFAQTNTQTKTSTKKVVSNAITQQAQEEEWAKKLFAESYTKEHHDKHTGKILAKSNVFTFGKSVLVLSNTKSDLKAIIAKGLLYPELFEIDLPMAESDTLTIQKIEELPSLNVIPTSKRFRFACSRKNLLNPTIYFIELTNEKATVQTSLSAFIKGSSLTFFADGWTQI